MSKLPFRPRSQKNEGLIAYLHRVANVNGFQSVTSMCRALNVSIQNLSGIFSTKYRERLISVLSKALLLEETTLKQLFNTRDALVSGTEHFYKNDVISHTKLCVKCIAGGYPMREEWDLYHSTYCNYHHTPLLYCCPVCNNLLTWHIDVANQCDSCKHVWQVSSALPVRLPIYHTFWTQLKAHRKELLSVFYEAVCYLNTPGALTIGLPRLPIPSSMTALQLRLEVAFDLICGTEQQQVTFLAKLLQSKNEANVFRVENLVDLAQLQRFSNVSASASSLLPLSRHIADHSDRLSAWKYGIKVNIQQLASLLRITRLNMRQIVETGFMGAPMDNGAANIYSLSYAEDLISRLRLNAIELNHYNSLKLLHLNRLMTIKTSRYLSFGERLAAIIGSRLSIYGDESGQSLASFYIDKTEVAPVFKMYAERLHGRQMTTKEVADHLCVTENMVREISKLDKWVKYTSTTRKVNFNPITLDNFLKRYFVVPYFCNATNCDEAKLRAYLNALEFPGFGQVKSTFTFYNKTEELNQAIKLFQNRYSNRTDAY